MSQTPRLRVVVVGVSHWHAPRYLVGLRALGEEIVGVSDPDPAVAGRVAQPPLTKIGEFTKDPRERVLRRGGKTEALPKGFEHFANR